MNDINKNDCLKLIHQSKRIIITTHTNPDGDAIGSALGLFYYLKTIGRSAFIINDSVTPSNLEFLDVNNEIRTFSYSDDNTLINNADLILILDLNDPKRLRTMQDIVLNSPAKKIMIDHHLSPVNFADYYYGDTNSASTGELVWSLISGNINLQNIPLANAVYTAIMTDTGSFRFEKTNSKTHRMIAELIDLGAKPDYCYEMVYNQSTLAALKMLGLAFSNLQLFNDQQLCIMELGKDMFDATGATIEDTEGFVEKTLSIKGVKLGILISYLRDKDEIRVSCRSKEGFVNARDVAVQFGGGGHTHAAGARIYNTDIANARNQIMQTVNSLIVENKFYNNVK
ncbi:MAG TPA: DHH family phosphoesterase [Candidatus Kapabacteria bacterium]|nr:DHH family phosphoesterase [Candidatus Kapabacteria bacterium]